ncbi:Pentatricopeptide repeat-containing protein [Acorus calamus]|uniref:Pentatricopeptide repeat-containing protein n=1 Tax=Acorus calamus TaxID=4465 RepID=A0AAV9ESQ7_ACOCL|nr:Pentatricopeptide repeat-containing protein [Acorus calamus]
MSSKPIPPPPSPHSSISTYLRRHRRYRLSHRHLKHLHAQIIRRSLHHDPFLLTDLISASFASGTVRYAARLFLSLPEPDVVLCNSMLKGFTQNHLPQLALSFYVTEFLELGFSPDGFTYPYLLKACAAASDAALGRQVHASVVKADSDAFVLNSLVDMYFKCGLREPALRVFRGIGRPNPATWNVMVSGFLNLGDVRSAMEMFDRMPYRDVVTYNTLMSAHMKNGDLEVARRLFEEMPERNHVSWNALISGLAQNGRNDEALSMFREMLDSGFEPDSTTVLAVVSVCCGGTHLPDEDLIVRIVSLAELSLNLVSVSTALLNMYAKFGEVEEARRIFDGIPEKDVVAWNAMIGGYSQNQRPADAVELFRLMQRECGDGVKADEQTMVSLVSSCGQLGVLSLGEWVHAFIEKNDIKSDVFLTTALIDIAVEIYAAWDGIVERIKPLGYKVDTGVLVKNILEEEEREEAVHRHSEKLALAFALICLEGDESKAPVRIVKNLRICSDCHNAMECVSKVEGREIIVRDRNRFHHFSDGRCSCGRYW